MTTRNTFRLPPKALVRVRTLQTAANAAAAQAAAAAAQVNEFLNGCALSLGVDLDSGEWTYDDRIGALVPKPPAPKPMSTPTGAPVARRADCV